MAAPTDFLRLYQELGLAPGASIEQIKHAYRRRVSELHPDRAGTLYSATTEDAAARLQQITLHYKAALQFYRQHGRLPGTVATARGLSPIEPAATVEAAVPARKSRTGFYLLAAGLVAAIWLVLIAPWDAGDTPTSQASPAVETAPDARVEHGQPEIVDDAALPGARRLKIGMEMTDVARIEDEPVTHDDQRWDYGPSWIEFDRGKVVDWYSSPLRPLKRASTRPLHTPVQEP